MPPDGYPRQDDRVVCPDISERAAGCKSHDVRAIHIPAHAFDRASRVALAWLCSR